MGWREVRQPAAVLSSTVDSNLHVHDFKIDCTCTCIDLNTSAHVTVVRKELTTDFVAECLHVFATVYSFCNYCSSREGRVYITSEVTAVIPSSLSRQVRGSPCNSL